jgi:hypothetical protein
MRVRAKKNSVEFIALALHFHTVLWAILGSLLHFIPADKLLRLKDQQKIPLAQDFCVGNTGLPPSFHSGG